MTKVCVVYGSDCPMGVADTVGVCMVISRRSVTCGSVSPVAASARIMRPGTSCATGTSC